jgi:Zn-dependent peptidase ImmA (M78 family)
MTMADVRKAILTGTYEAARTHDVLHSRELWEHDGGRIDVFGAIDHFGLPLMFQPMEGLLGAYLTKPSPGVLINTRRPLSVRRYTAAHELGHHRLGHEPSLDGEDMLGRTPFSDRLIYDEKEAEADAFAIAFLLPLWFVSGQMKRHGWTPASMKGATAVYQLALRAGTSYEATCYALTNHKVIDATTCSTLVEVKPKEIKQSIVPDYQPATWHLDVWHLGPGDDGLFVEATPGDVVEVCLLEHSGGGYLWDTGGIAQSDLELVSDQRQRDGLPDTVGGHVTRRLVARAKTPGVGSVRFVERRPWERGTPPISSYQITYDISAIGQPGLLQAQRNRMMGEAK